MPTPANNRYEVGIVGTPDPPGSQYVVLNLVGDIEARVAVAKLANRYEQMGAPSQANDLRQMLERSQEADRAFYEKRNEALTRGQKGRKNTKRDRTDRP